MTENKRAPTNRNHQRRKDSKQGSLAAAVRAEQPKQLCRPDVKRNPIQRRPPVIAVHYIAHSYDRSACKLLPGIVTHYCDGRYVRGQRSILRRAEPRRGSGGANLDSINPKASRRRRCAAQSNENSKESERNECAKTQTPPRR